MCILQPPITQDLTLIWDGHMLKEGVHYTATYTDNEKVGTAKIQIVANLGTKDLTFKINYRKGWNEDATGWCYKRADGTCTWPYKGSWKKSSKGWWFGDTSGWYAKNETLRIDGKSYTFDAKGYLKE